MSIEIYPDDDNTLPYQVFLNLENEHYYAQAIQLAQLFAHDVDDNGQLDMAKAVKKAQSQPDLAIVATNNMTLKKSFDTLSALTTTLSNQLKIEGVLGISHDTYIQNILSHAFCDLETQKDKPWFHVNTLPQAGHQVTSYSYSLFIVSQGEETGAMMAAGPLIINVTPNTAIADIFSTKNWRLTLQKEEITIEIKGFQIVTPLG
ncbi:type-1Ba cytolytic delta-endotoxin [Dickeya fangzhongdai]|uniref:type-1Ba cytolytic delta-endotoxin n=1 Tax=Dickeya fangzhongdai TaxID=1778540 RepID=UPI0005748A24|nr:type-1Ba cytolytic delta-endotoxin [Dickeya fangzhongdai]KHN58204.1 type-1Ba cytolytic delta-endotoxin [Dickeya fangzhongdai]